MPDEPSPDLEDLEQQLDRLVERFGRATVLATIPSGKKRGRPKGSGINDQAALAKMADLLVSGQVPDGNESEAARRAVSLAPRHSERSAIHRLCRKFREQRQRQLKAARIRRDLVLTAPPLIAWTAHVLEPQRQVSEALLAQQKLLASRVKEFVRNLEEPAMQFVRARLEMEQDYAELVRKSTEFLSKGPASWTKKPDK